MKQTLTKHIDGVWISDGTTVYPPKRSGSFPCITEHWIDDNEQTQGSVRVMTDWTESERIYFYGECALIGGMMLTDRHRELCVVIIYRTLNRIGVDTSHPEQLPQIEDDEVFHSIRSLIRMAGDALSPDRGAAHDEAFKGVLSCLYAVALKRASCWSDTNEVK